MKEAWQPGDLGYATRVPADMLIVTIVFCYSVIAPVIIPFGVLYFGLGWLVLRNQVKSLLPCYFEITSVSKYFLTGLCIFVLINRHSKSTYQHMKVMEECGLTYTSVY